MAEARHRGLGFLGHWRTIAGVLLAVIVANVLLYALVVRPRLLVAGDREAILATERAELGELAAEIEALERTVSRIACSRSDADHVLEDLVSSKAQRLTAIDRELWELERDMRVDPERVSYSWTEADETGLVRFRAAFGFEAPYATLREFIERIETSDNFLFIQQVTLTGSRATESQLRLHIQVATWFRGVDPEKLGATFSRRRRS